MPPRAIGWIIGGALCAAGVLNLLFSFGLPGGADHQFGTNDIARSLDRVGFDAIQDLTVYPRFLISAICLGIGLPTLVGLNATQWKNTGGY